MGLKRHFLILPVLFLITNFYSYPQKVGLVLSGGGAKGIAHAGVISALEEENIPIDYIIGTSMGGIIGSMYASGFSADEIRSLVLSQTFQDWVNGKIPTEYYYYLNHRDDPLNMIHLDLTFDSLYNAYFKTVIATDRSLNFAITEELAQPSQRANYKFDSLFIPYRCITSEIFTGQQRVMSQGSLAAAVRATMSVPFFFPPIKIENQYLFDGGIYNNFPLDVMRKEFAPDHLIGVNVSDTRKKEYPFGEDDQHMNDAILDLFMDMYVQVPADSDLLYIAPNLLNFSAASFTQAQAIYDSGYVAAKRLIPKIKSSIQVRKDSVELKQERLNFRSGFKPLTFNEIVVNGYTTNQEKFIRKIFQKKDKVFDLDDVKKGYFFLTSEKYFRNIFPDIYRNPEDEHFTFGLSGDNSNLLDIGIGGTIATKNINQFVLDFNYYYLNKLFYNHAMKFHVGQFYQSFDYKTEITFPGKYIFKASPFLSLDRWNYLAPEELIFDESGSEIIPLTNNNFSAGLKLITPVKTNNFLEFEASFFRSKFNYSNVNFLSTIDTLDNLIVKGLSLKLSFEKSTLNHPQYGYRGKYLGVTGSYYRGILDYSPGNTFSYEIPNYHSVKTWAGINIKYENYYGRGRFIPGIKLESNFSSHFFYLNERTSYLLSRGSNPLPDSRIYFIEELRSPFFASAGGIINYRISDDLLVRGESHLFIPFSTLNSTDQTWEYQTRSEDLVLATGLSLVYHTRFGPVSLLGTWYNIDRLNFGAMLHFGFILFNKTPIEP
ncbi:patatin-like phospholipase family protein [Marinigracilibium pacificum]|uniref:Patatin-like phospholipase family protein n=1 Tax=Marinigracilibium pacificum TaxID=2729599 RepID=A0A848IYP8_9BACT|nr:patatin-like phospholipase family protein [Marinigracilibium pacificum]NMM47119.1 patatin-like phospholipase family protein [Marinigracilibium pacificum]